MKNNINFFQENKQTFITAFDIYNTIGNIIYGDKYANIPNKTWNEDSFKSILGISLFNKINPKERFLKNIHIIVRWVQDFAHKFMRNYKMDLGILVHF